MRIVAQMDEPFAIDAQARQERLSQEDRQFLRLEKIQAARSVMNNSETDISCDKT